MVVDFKNYNLNAGVLYFEWSSDLEDPIYYIYRNGIFLGEQVQNNYTVNDLQDGEIIRFEVFDNPEDKPELFFDNYFFFNFFVNDINNLREFLVEESVNGGPYRPTKSIFIQAEHYFYSIRSEFYNDGDDIAIKITPVLNSRKKGVPFEFHKKIVTYPDNLNSNLYLDNGKVLIELTADLNDLVTVGGDPDQWDFSE